MSRLRALARARLAYGKQLAGAVLWYGIPAVVDRLAARLETKPDPDDLLPGERAALQREHDDWCDANGCRCGKCPCLGPPLCKPPRSREDAGHRWRNA